MNSLWMHAWRARADGTATDERLALVKAQADGLEDGRKTLADAREAVDAGTATEEQMAMVEGMAKGLADGPKAMRDKAAAAAAAAGRQTMRCCGSACTETGPEGGQHRYTEVGKQKFCGYYRLHL